MARDLSTVRVGDRLEVVVRGTGIHRQTFEAVELEAVHTAGVHYVRRRGDFQIQLDDGPLLWVDPDGWVRDVPHNLTAFVRWPKEGADVA